MARSMAAAAMWGVRIAGVAAAALALGSGPAAQPAAAGPLHTSEWALSALKAGQAWRHSKGAGVTVAVVGTGVDASHPDLASRVTAGADFGNAGGNRGRQDTTTDDGQGTHVASLIAADAANYRGNGLYGIAPQARILPLGIISNGSPSATAAARAVRYAVARGVRIIDVAVGFRTASPALRSAVGYAVRHGAVIVTGAGDDGATGDRPVYPAAFPGAVAVAATDARGAVWPASYHGRAVLLAAPGVHILCAARDGTYWTGDGTQYAAAWVAGSAALLRSAHPSWTRAQILAQMTATAGRHDAKGRRNPGYGYGIIRPASALAHRAAPPGAAAEFPAGGQAAAPRDGAPGASSHGSGGDAAWIAVLAVAGVAAVGAAIVLARASRKPPRPF